MYDHNCWSILSELGRYLLWHQALYLKEPDVHEVATPYVVDAAHADVLRHVLARYQQILYGLLVRFVGLNELPLVDIV